MREYLKKSPKKKEQRQVVHNIHTDSRMGCIINSKIFSLVDGYHTFVPFVRCSKNALNT
jgi:hypothetical protein